MTTNPVGLLEPLHVPAPETPVLSEQEVAALLNAYRLAETASDVSEAVWWALTRRLTAFALGTALRRGEILGLRWGDVEMLDRRLHVRRSFVLGEFGEPKSRAGRRSVPIVAALRDLLVEHKLTTRRDHGFVFGTSATSPFTPNVARGRARTAWRRAGLEPIGLHECRHTFASLVIAAGVNAKAITAYLGHASIQTTFDLYGHLMPGNEDEAVALVDAYLERAGTERRLAQLDA